MKKLLARAGVVAAAAALPLIGLALPAQAYSEIKVCNSVDGNAGDIMVWRSGTNAYYVVHDGNCAPWLGNTYDEVSVDTNWSGYSRSYKIKPDGGSYGPCHDHSTNSASNPPGNGTVYYKHYKTSDCTT